MQWTKVSYIFLHFFPFSPTLQQVPQLVEKYMAGDLPIEPYITHVFEGVESIDEAMHVLRQSQCLRAVVKY